MKCENCEKQITHGYFWEGESVKYICTDCLLRYRQTKYDRQAIVKHYNDGFSVKTIATQFDTNPLTVEYIVRRGKSGL